MGLKAWLHTSITKCAKLDETKGNQEEKRSTALGMSSDLVDLHFTIRCQVEHQ